MKYGSLMTLEVQLLRRNPWKAMHDKTPLSKCMVRFQRTLDESAFETIFSTLYRPALAVAGQLLPDDASAEDAVQSTFMKVVRKRATYDGRRPFEPWFYRILRNTCRDALRRRGACPEIPAPEYAIRNASAASTTDYGLQEAFGKLPAQQRAVLELRIVHGMRFPEIGEALGITEEAAKKRAQRGLRALRRAYRADRDVAGTSGP